MKIKKYIPHGIAAILGILLFIQTNNYKGAKDQITQLDLDNQTLRTLVNQRGDTIYTQKSLITSSREAINNLTDSIFLLKRKDSKNQQTIAYYKGVTKIEVRNVSIPYMDTLSMKRFSDSVENSCAEVITYMRDSTISVPQRLSVSTQNAFLEADVTKSGLYIDSLSIPDTLQLRFVERGGFLKRKTIEVQYLHSNKYIHSLSTNSVVYSPKKSLLTRVILPVAIGIGVGLIISK